MSPLIEGFGNDAVLFLGVTLTLSLSVPLSLLYSQRQRQRQRARELARDRYRDEDNTINQDRDAVNVNEPDSIARPANNYGIGDEECPICMENFGERVVTTNCGHNFDLSCFMTYCNHQSRSRRVSCPACRQSVSLLFPNFDASENEREGGGSTEADAHLDAFRRYNQYNGHMSRTYVEVIRDLPELLRQIFLDTQLSRRLLSTAQRIKMVVITVGACLYLLSPIDLIPESIFGLIGILDDILVVVISLLLMTSIFREIYVLRYM